jgi:DNA-binding beta-propeller fold protein YncE
LYVTNYSSGTISKVRKATGVLEGSFNANVGVHDIFYEAHQLWVASQEQRTILRINSADGALLETVPFAEGVVPAAISFDGVRVWSTNLNTASVSAF